MAYTTLITPAQLNELQQSSAQVLVFDCGFDLSDRSAGQRNYDAGHLPGAVHIDLETELSGAANGLNGRHPLPKREAFQALMARLGANDDTQIVAYDAAAPRLWWMLRWIGHSAVAVLDGGLPAWKAAGYPARTQAEPPRPAGSITLRAPLAATVGYDQVLANLNDGAYVVLDARAPDRFRGENETVDAIGGHIPGAVNRLFRDNLDADGRFKSAARLRAEFEAVLGQTSPQQVINQCGSGVTACHNLLAMEIAGLGGAALYPGSWSEWSSRPGSPIATGE